MNNIEFHFCFSDLVTNMIFVLLVSLALFVLIPGCGSVATENRPAPAPAPMLGECKMPEAEHDGYKLFRCDLVKPGGINSWLCAYVKPSEEGVCFAVIRSENCGEWMLIRNDCMSRKDLERVDFRDDEQESVGRCNDNLGECA